MTEETKLYKSPSTNELESFKKAYPEINRRVLDSGKRYENENGGVRDTEEGKPDFVLVDDIIFDLLAVNGQMKMSGVFDEICSVSRLFRFIFDKYEKGIVDDLTEDRDSIKFKIANIITSLVCELGEYDYYKGVERFAFFMEKCLEKYEFENWKRLNTDNDLKRLFKSMKRHYVKHCFERKDEFHLEATIFNAMCIAKIYSTENVVYTKRHQ